MCELSVSCPLLSLLSMSSEPECSLLEHNYGFYTRVILCFPIDQGKPYTRLRVIILYACFAYRFGDIVEVVSILGYPFQSSQRCETLVNAMLRFSSGKTAVLHCHYNDIPMHPLPFFQIFGNKVAM